jgi:hypothetical protein
MTMTQCGHVGRGLPDALAALGEQGGSRFEDFDRVGQKPASFVGRGGETVDARCPRAKLHALLEVDGPDDYVAACGQVAYQDVETTALAGTGRATEEDVSAQEENFARRGVFEWAKVDWLRDRVG